MTGVGRLIRLILRRDRVLIPLSVVLLGAIPTLYVSSFQELFPTEAERHQYATVSAANAGFVALYGPLEGTSLGELVAWRAGFIPVLVALFALLTVIRHTRADEEQGRTELVGAAAISRHAPLAAALITTVAASVILGLITTTAMLAQDMPAAGSAWFGAELALAGILFAAVGAVTAQLTGSARGARGYAIVALGAAYVVRLAGDVSAIGDGGLSWLSWLSPIGWVQHILPYGGNHGWPAALALLVAALVAAAAVRLLGRRDFGGGLFPDRPGPATAAPGLRSPFALAWRLHRGLLLAWTAGFAVLGLLFGGVGNSVVDLSAGSEELATIFNRLGGSDVLVDSFFAGTSGIVGLIAACYAVQAAGRMREEEAGGHAEMILATPVSRWAWAGGHVLFALLGPALVLTVEGLVAGLTYGGIVGDVGGELPPILGGLLAQIPAVWVLAAVAILCFGLLPRLTGLAWGAVALCLLLLLAGTALRLDRWVLDISPFTHLPQLPGGEVTWTPLIVLTAVAAAISAAGLAGVRRRGIPA